MFLSTRTQGFTKTYKHGNPLSLVSHLKEGLWPTLPWAIWSSPLMLPSSFLNVASFILAAIQWVYQPWTRLCCGLYVSQHALHPAFRFTLKLAHAWASTSPCPYINNFWRNQNRSGHFCLWILKLERSAARSRECSRMYYFFFFVQVSERLGVTVKVEVIFAFTVVVHATRQKPMCNYSSSHWHISDKDTVAYKDGAGTVS